MPADVGYDASNLFYRAAGGIVGRRSRLRRQQMPAAEDTERQIAVRVVVTVEVSAVLVALQRIIGRIDVDVDDDAHRRFAMSFKEQIHEQPLGGPSLTISVPTVRLRSCGEAPAIPSSFVSRAMARVTMLAPIGTSSRVGEAKTY